MKKKLFLSVAAALFLCLLCTPSAYGESTVEENLEILQDALPREAREQMETFRGEEGIPFFDAEGMVAAVIIRFFPSV